MGFGLALVNIINIEQINYTLKHFKKQCNLEVFSCLNAFPT